MNAGVKLPIELILNVELIFDVTTKPLPLPQHRALTILMMGDHS